MTSWTALMPTTYSLCCGPRSCMACWTMRHDWKVGTMTIALHSNEKSLGKPHGIICLFFRFQSPVISTIPFPQSQDSSIIRHGWVEWCSTLSPWGVGFWDLFKAVSESWRTEPFMLDHHVALGFGSIEEQVAVTWNASWVMRINHRWLKVTRNLT